MMDSAKSSKNASSSNKSDKNSKKKNKKSVTKDNFKKQFIGNKKEGQGFADKRKKKAAYEYLKLIKKQKKQAEQEGRQPTQHRPLAFLSPRSNESGKKGHAFSVAEKIARKKKDEKLKKKEEKEKVQQDTASALSAYKQRKKERWRKLNQRTGKGQPLMGAQMELLLDKIQQQKGH